MAGNRIWRIVRRTWVTVGLGATAVFTVWSLIAYRASGAAREAMANDAAVEVVHGDATILFTPVGRASGVGMILYPGGLVDPVAYAPLAHRIAAEGFPVVIVPLPTRGAFGGAESPVVPMRTDSIIADPAGPERWVVAGHSRGGVVASSFAATRADRIAGLLLLGTTHPRDVDLSDAEYPVVKVMGGRDGLARPAAVEANARLLPAHTRWVRLEGGNHSQFAAYGFQPGDRPATLGRAAQHEAVVNAALSLLRQVAEDAD